MTPYGKPLTIEWRLNHIETADKLLSYLEAPPANIDTETVSGLVSLAQVHYAAATILLDLEVNDSD